MRLKVSGGNVALDEPLREEIETRVRFALGRFSSRIGQVSARVEDLNGPRGGRDKRCRIIVKMRGSGQLSVEAMEEELSEAVSRAADRAARRVQRELERRREGRYFGPDHDEGTDSYFDELTDSDLDSRM